MSINKFKPHLLVIPEDDANRQLARGFTRHPAIVTRTIVVLSPARGWTHVLGMFQRKYITYLRKFDKAYVVLLLDFDDKDDRRAFCEKSIPEDLKDRVLLIGSRDEPEAARAAIGQSLESIGLSLADECHKDHYTLWTNEHFDHNNAERLRLAPALRSVLFL